MRKFNLLAAAALSTLAAACAQTGQSTANADFCDQLSQEAFMQAVEDGKCDLDVTTAAGTPEPDKSFGHDSDHGGDSDDSKEPEGGKEPEGDPEPDPDPDSGNEPPSTEPASDAI